MSTAKRWRVLLVTGGRTHQENYAESFRADPRAEIVAVTDEQEVDDYRRAHNLLLARRLGVPYVEPIERALEQVDCDILSICAEPDRRGRVILNCMSLTRKAFYLDKSLCASLEEARQIRDEARRRHLMTHMYTNITQPWARAARSDITSGRLGEIVAVHADTYFAKGTPGTARPERRKETYPPDPRTFQTLRAKRELDNVGVYPITLLCWLLGCKIRRLYALTANYFFREHQEAGAEDFAAMVGETDSGVPFSITCGRIGWTSHPGAGVNRVIVVGKKRTGIYDMNSPRLVLSNADAPWRPPVPHPEDPMFFWASTQREAGVQPKRFWLPLRGDPHADVRYFLDCLERGIPSEADVELAAHATEVIFAAYRSAALEDWVDVSG